jgi:hypothetical protein
LYYFLFIFDCSANVYIFIFVFASLPGGPHLSGLSSPAAVTWNLTAASWNPITAA